MADDVLVIHRGLALMLCEDTAILEETLLAIEPLDLHIRRLGDRALLVPADQVEGILENLRQQGTFPRLVGDLSRPKAEENNREADAEEVS